MARVRRGGGDHTTVYTAILVVHRATRPGKVRGVVPPDTLRSRPVLRVGRKGQVQVFAGVCTGGRDPGVDDPGE